MTFQDIFQDDIKPPKRLGEETTIQPIGQGIIQPVYFPYQLFQIAA